MSGRRNVRNDPGLGLKARLAERRGIGGLARLLAGRLLGDRARRADLLGLDRAADGAGVRRRHAAVVLRPCIACRAVGMRRKVDLDDDVVVRHREGLCALVPAQRTQIDLFARALAGLLPDLDVIVVIAVVRRDRQRDRRGPVGFCGAEGYRAAAGRVDLDRHGVQLADVEEAALVEVVPVIARRTEVHNDDSGMRVVDRVVAAARIPRRAGGGVSDCPDDLDLGSDRKVRVEVVLLAGRRGVLLEAVRRIHLPVRHRTDQVVRGDRDRLGVGVRVAFKRRRRGVDHLAGVVFGARHLRGDRLGVAAVARADEGRRRRGVAVRVVSGPRPRRRTPVVSETVDRNRVAFGQVIGLTALRGGDRQVLFFAGQRGEVRSRDRRARGQRRLALHGVRDLDLAGRRVEVDGDEQVRRRTLCRAGAGELTRVVADLEQAVRGRCALGERNRAACRRTGDRARRVVFGFNRLFIRQLRQLDRRVVFGLFRLDRFFVAQFRHHGRLFVDRLRGSIAPAHLLGFRRKARHDVLSHQLFAGRGKLQMQLAEVLAAHDFILVADGRRCHGTVDVHTGHRPDVVAEVAGAPHRPVGNADDDQLAGIAVRMRPVEVGAVIVQVLIQERGADAGLELLNRI